MIYIVHVYEICYIVFVQDFIWIPEKNFGRVGSQKFTVCVVTYDHQQPSYYKHWSIKPFLFFLDIGTKCKILR